MVSARWPKKSLRKLDDACGVSDDLHGFNARDIVEEPSAACVHELRVTLHFHELERVHALIAVKGVARRARQGNGLVLSSATVKDDLDVGVARGPHLAEIFCAYFIGQAD